MIRSMTDRRFGCWAGRIAITFGYPTVLVVTSAVAAARPDAVRREWFEWASTNLANLDDHPISAMVSSAFLAEDNVVAWAVLAAVGLGATGWVLGFRRTTLLVVAAHLIGTLISEGILAIMIARGERPGSERYLVDVGPSYVVVCALVAAICYGRWPGRILAGTGFALLSPHLFAGLPRLEVTSVGHTCSIVIAVAGGWALVRWSHSSQLGAPRVREGSDSS
jgi:hypothetical protein